MFKEDGSPIHLRFEGSIFAKLPLDTELNEDVDVAELLRNDCQYAFVAVPENMSEKSVTGKRHVCEVEIVGVDNYGYEGGNFILTLFTAILSRRSKNHTLTKF